MTKTAEDLMTPPYREALMHVGHLYAKEQALFDERDDIDDRLHHVAAEIKRALQLARSLDTAVKPLAKALAEPEVEAKALPETL